MANRLGASNSTPDALPKDRLFPQQRAAFGQMALLQQSVSRMRPLAQAHPGDYALHPT